MPTPGRPTSSDTPRAYKIFVSSTYLDNKERRKIIQDAVSRVGMVWHGMEIFTASPRPTVEESVRRVSEADLLAGIIAWRYGWEPEGEEKSITEMEYDAAETSAVPFEELSRTASGKNKQFWRRQLVALRMLEQLNPEAVEALQSKLARHPSADIRQWIRERAIRAAQDEKF